jgi:cyclopropane-fatty-acyl-phospholipid synthase
MANQSQLRAQGFRDSFLRMWEYYLRYCERGFEERQLGNVQMLLTKPRSQRASLTTIHAPAA